jgi:hypothetical protein
MTQLRYQQGELYILKIPFFPLEYDYYEMPSEKCQINNTDMKNKVTY